MGEDIARDYALNRMELRKVNTEISQLFEDSLCLDSNGMSTAEPIDLQDLRKEWLEYHDPYGANWPGWVSALHFLEDVTEDQFKLAALLDIKKEVKRQAGIIKNRLYAAGVGILKNQKNLANQEGS